MVLHETIAVFIGQYLYSIQKRFKFMLLKKIECF